MMVLVMRSVSSSVAPPAGPTSPPSSVSQSGVDFTLALGRMTALAMVRNMRVPGTRLHQETDMMDAAHSTQGQTFRRRLLPQLAHRQMFASLHTKRASKLGYVP